MSQDQDERDDTDVVPTRYRVSGQRVTVATRVDPDKPGRAEIDFFRGEVLPEDVPDEHIQRLLGAHEIEVIDNRSDAGANVADGQSETVDGHTGEVVSTGTLAEDGITGPDAETALAAAATSHGEPVPTGTGLGAAASLPSGDLSATAADEDGEKYDPGAYSVPDVREHLLGLDENPDERERILQAERDGKNRKGIVGPSGTAE